MHPLSDDGQVIRDLCRRVLIALVTRSIRRDFGADCATRDIDDLGLDAPRCGSCEAADTIEWLNRWHRLMSDRS